VSVLHYMYTIVLEGPFVTIKSSRPELLTGTETGGKKTQRRRSSMMRFRATISFLPTTLSWRLDRSSTIVVEYFVS
jgi:hypothetical protein